jgi:hypothetical protein
MMPERVLEAIEGAQGAQIARSRKGKGSYEYYSYN